MASSLEKMRCLAENVVTMYVSRLETLSQTMGDTYDLLDRGRVEREQMGDMLRDLLAGGTSLRRKDFDQMMRDVFERQNERERAVRVYMKGFLKEQADLAEKLRGALQGGDLEQVKPIQSSIEKGMAEAKQMLLDFHHEEQTLMRRLKVLLDKGDGLTVAEFKTAVTQMRSDLSVWTEQACAS